MLSHSAHLVDELVRKSLEPLDVHPGQARVLDALHRMGEVSQRHLASEFHVSAASMSEMTKRLISNGFIKMRKDPKDARTSLLSLTTKGENLLGQVFATWSNVDQIIINAIGDDNAEVLFQHCLDLRDTLGGRAPGASGKRKISLEQGRTSSQAEP